MKHSIRCNKCNQMASVNGQKQISRFVGEHKHGDKSAGMTGENIELDIKADRVQLKIDKPELITGLPYRARNVGGNKRDASG